MNNPWPATSEPLNRQTQLLAELIETQGTMDIEDILRDVDPDSHSIPSETRDLQALTRCWVAERSAPELLGYVD